MNFIRAHATGNGNGGRARADISIYGQESNYNTWRLCKMNLAIRGIEGQIAQGDSFHDDRFPDLHADYILDNPPFNVSDWGGERLREDKRWRYGVPPAGNANFAWVAAHLPSPLALRRGRLCARQRLYVLQPVGRGRNPQGHHRGRPGGLHGGVAGAALLLNADSGLPVVPRSRQIRTPLSRRERGRG